MSLLKLWFIRNPVLVSYSICVRQGSSNLSGSQSALTCLCVCARAQLGLREFNSGGADKVIDDKLNQFGLSLDCTPSFTEVTTNETAALDSGCTSNFLSATAPCGDKQAAHVPLNVDMPNGTTIQWSHTCNLLLAYLTPQA
jgi:hypothetical protein